MRCAVKWTDLHHACSYHDIVGGGYDFANQPSPPNGRTAASILSRQGLREAAALAKAMTVREAVEDISLHPG